MSEEPDEKTDDAEAAQAAQAEAAEAAQVEEAATPRSGAFELLPLTRERQRLQLCAVHAINNLLQLSHPSPSRKKKVDDDGAGSEPAVWGYRVSLTEGERGDEDNDGSGVNSRRHIFSPRKPAQLSPVSKSELDSIADALTLTEDSLVSSKFPTPGEIAGPVVAPLFMKLTSSHRTVVTGNYSFEVLEMALKRRGAELGWFLMPDEEREEEGMGVCDLPPETNDGVGDSGGSGGGVLRNAVIGFVLNDARAEGWYSRPIKVVRYIPVVGGAIGSGRHWYVVTRLRAVGRSTVTSDEQDGSGDTDKLDGRKKEEEEDCLWHVIDSKDSEARPLRSDSELEQFLRRVQDGGGQIFRVTMRLSPEEEERGG